MSDDVGTGLEISPEAQAEIQQNLDSILGGQEESEPKAPSRSPKIPSRYVIDSPDGPEEGSDGDKPINPRSIDDTLDENGQPVAKDWIDPSLIGKDEAEDDAEAADEPDAQGDEPDGGDDQGYLVEAARRAGWTDVEAQEFMKQSPELAAKTFQRFHEAENNLTNQFAAIGRIANQLQNGQQPVMEQPAQQTPEPSQQQIPQQALPPTQLAPPKFDNERLKQIVDDDVYEMLVKPQMEWANQITSAYNQRMVQMEAQARQWQTQQDDALIKQTDSFFDSTDPSDGFGPKKQAYDLTPQEAQMRDQVLEHAKNLIVGRKLSTGEDMSLNDALAQAYRAATYNNVRQREASKLKQSATKWSKQATLRPTQRRPVKDRGENPDAKAIAAAESKLSEIFKN